MRLSRPWFAFFALVIAPLAAPHPGRTQVLDPIQYTLFPQSDLEYGCFGPCACPVVTVGPLRGDFTFYRTSVDPLFSHYALVNIAWTYTVSGATPHTVHMTGHGTYDLGGEVALTQRMTLDLRSDGGPEQHFDSGVGSVKATFPVIDILVYAHANACLDSVLHVVAAPFGVVSVGPAAAPLLRRVTPNPTSGAAEIVLALPSAGHARVDVVGVDGRVVATLTEGEFTAGEQRLRWNGRTSRGADAGAGLFWVRARVGGRVDAQRIVRLR